MLSTTSTHLYPSQLVSAVVHVGKWAYTWLLLSDPNNSFTSTIMEHGLATARIPVKKKFFPAQNLFSTIMYIANIYDLTIKTDQGP